MNELKIYSLELQISRNWMMIGIDLDRDAGPVRTEIGSEIPFFIPGSAAASRPFVFSP